MTTKTIGSLSSKVIAAYLGVVLVVGVGGTVVLSQMPPTQTEPPAPIEEVVPVPFAPEVEITMDETLSANLPTEIEQVPGSTTLRYPAYTEIQTSQGTPYTWRILAEEEETVIAEDRGANIEAETFAALNADSYRIEWLINGEQNQA